MKSKKTVFSYMLLIVGVIILVNILASRYFFRLDFTEEKRYTLSDATKDILKSMKNPVTVTAYFSEDLPPAILQTKNEFKELLVEYASRSKGKVVYEFINPNKDEETERKAQQAGIMPLMINSNEKDQAKVQKAYLGSVIQLGEKSEIMQVLPGSPMEYNLSSAIKKLSVENKPVIGLLQGHGEPSLNGLRDAMNALSILYQVEPVTLNDSINNLLKYKTVAIIAPKDTIRDSHLKQLDEFLAQGKNLYVAINRVSGDFSNASGNLVSTGLEKWLSQKGVIVEGNFIVDSKCGAVSVQQPNFPFPVQMQFPYLPIISNFADHPVTKGLSALLLQFASTITFTGDSTVKFKPVAMTTNKSGTKPAPLYFDINKDWNESDFPLANLTVAAVVSGKLSGSAQSRLVIISDGDFAVNGEGQNQVRQLQPDNVNLMVNSIDWLSDDTGLIELRTKGVAARPLDPVEDATRTLLKYFNFLLPIILIIIYGIFRMQYRRNLRIKRMEENYV